MGMAMFGRGRTLLFEFGPSAQLVLEQFVVPQIWVYVLVF